MELWKAEAKEEDEAKEEEEVKAGDVLVVLGLKKLCEVRNSWRGSYEYPEAKPATQISKNFIGDFGGSKHVSCPTLTLFWEIKAFGWNSSQQFNTHSPGVWFRVEGRSIDQFQPKHVACTMLQCLDMLDFQVQPRRAPFSMVLLPFLQAEEEEKVDPMWLGCRTLCMIQSTEGSDSQSLNALGCWKLSVKGATKNESYSRYHLGSHARCNRFDLQEA